MCAQWKKGYDPQFALIELGAKKKVSDKGEVNFSGPLFEDCLGLLYSSVAFSSDLPEDTTRGIIFQSVFSAAKADKLSSEWLLSEISRREQEHNQKPISPYFMAASISINSKAPLKRIESSSCTIKFGDEIPKIIQDKEKEYPRIFYQAMHTEPPRDYTRIVIETTGRSITEAGWQALNAFDCYRAIWNLGLNLSHFQRMSIGPVHPVNEIVLGPLQTLFRGDRTLIEDHWWYQRNYQYPVKVKDVTEVWSDLRKYEKKAMAKLHKSIHKDFLMKALRRYVRALDGTDYESVFLKLWGLLEFLTQSTYDRYDVTIRRAAFLWKDYGLHREILNHLRDSRNTAVHLDVFGEQGEELVYRLKRYVEALLHFLIFNGSDFKTKDEMKQFLDLAPGKATLSEKYRLLRRGIKFRSN